MSMVSFNFGPSASHMASMCKRAQIIVVEVNQNMPRCLGGFNEGIHISQVTHIVEGDNPPIAEMGASKATALMRPLRNLLLKKFQMVLVSSLVSVVCRMR